MLSSTTPFCPFSCPCPCRRRRRRWSSCSRWYKRTRCNCLEVSVGRSVLGHRVVCVVAKSQHSTSTPPPSDSCVCVQEFTLRNPIGSSSKLERTKKKSKKKRKKKKNFEGKPKKKRKRGRNKPSVVPQRIGRCPSDKSMDCRRHCRFVLRTHRQ